MGVALLEDGVSPEVASFAMAANLYAYVVSGGSAALL
jgi:hypothetical protein